MNFVVVSENNFYLIVKILPDRNGREEEVKVIVRQEHKIERENIRKEKCPKNHSITSSRKSQRT